MNKQRIKNLQQILQKQKRGQQIFNPGEINKLLGKDSFNQQDLQKAYSTHGGLERYMDDIKDAVMHKIEMALPQTEEYKEIKDGISDGIAKGIQEGLGEYIEQVKIEQDKNSKRLLGIIDKALGRKDYKTVTERLRDKKDASLQTFGSLKGILGLLGIGKKEGGIIDTALNRRLDKKTYIQQAMTIDPTMSRAMAAKQFEQQQKLQKLIIANDRKIEAFTRNGWSEEQLKGTSLVKERDRLAKGIQEVDPRFQRDKTESEIEAANADEIKIDLSKDQLTVLESIRDNLGVKKKDEPVEKSSPIGASILETLGGLKDVLFSMKPLLAGIGSVLGVAAAAYAGWKAGELLNDKIINPAMEKMTGVKGQTLGGGIYDFVDAFQDRTGNSVFGQSDSDKFRKAGLNKTPDPARYETKQYDEMGNVIGMSATDYSMADPVDEASSRNKKLAQVQQINTVVAPTSNTVNNSKTVMPSYTPPPKQSDSSVNRYISGRMAF